MDSRNNDMVCQRQKYRHAENIVIMSTDPEGLSSAAKNYYHGSNKV